MTTTDIGDFGYRELEATRKLLEQAQEGWPDDFDLEGVKLMFNQNSGDVFFTNDRGDACMAGDDGRLFMWYMLVDGNEGSFEDLVEQWDQLSADEQKELRNIAAVTGRELDK